MGQYKSKPKKIEALTFEELVEYGRANGANIVNGMPWSFTYHGHAITHENDECFLIPAPNGNVKFTPNDMLVVEGSGWLGVYDKVTFLELNQKITDSDEEEEDGEGSGGNHPGKPGNP